MGMVSSFQTRPPNNLSQPPVGPPAPPPAKPTSYQAGGTTAAMAALDLKSEAQSRERLLAPPFDRQAFQPQVMDVPEAMSLPEFVREHFPGLRRGQQQPKGTNRQIMTAYRQHLQQTSQTRKAAQMHNNRMGIGREQLDLKRAEFNAKEAARRVNPDNFKTFEAMMVNQTMKLPPHEWADDPIIGRWFNMKMAAGKDLPSSKPIIAMLTSLAVEEMLASEDKKTPGPYANALAVATDPVAALKLMTAGKKPRTLAQIKAEALELATAGKSPEETLKIARGKGDDSVITGTKFGQETFGEFGGFGGITADLKKGMTGFVKAVERAQQMGPMMNDSQKSALSEMIRNTAPTPSEIVKAGPTEKGGTGELTEEQVNQALEYVLTPEQRRSLLGQPTE